MKYFRSKIYNSIYIEIEADDRESASRRAMAIYDSGALDNLFFDDASASYDNLVLSDDISDIPERDVYNNELYHTLLKEAKEAEAEMKPSMPHEEFLKRLSSFGFILEEGEGAWVTGYTLPFSMTAERSQSFSSVVGIMISYQHHFTSQ